MRVTHWDGVYDATNFGPNCMGMAAFKPEDPESFYCREFRAGLPYTYSEDCQVLNIYAPDDAEKAPVIVYIHGGAYMGGSGWDKVFDEPRWPEQGVIAVTLNYRLGIFGTVRLPELSADLWYWFGTLRRGWRPFEPADYDLSDIMRGYLLNFARTDNPNGEGLPLWETSGKDGRFLLLDERCEMAQEIPAPRKENTL